MWSRGVFVAQPGAFGQSTRPGFVERGTAEDPWAIDQRVKGFDLGIRGGEPE